MIAPDNIDTLVASSSGKTQLAYIKTLRNAIVGHDDEKLRLLKTRVVPALLAVLEDGPDENRAEAAVTIASFASAPQASVSLLAKYPIVPALTKLVAPSTPGAILAPILRSLTSILSTRPTSFFLTRALAKSLSRFLLTPTTPAAVIDLCCVLIPLTNTSRVPSPCLTPLTHSLVLRIYSLAHTDVALVAIPLESALFALAHVLEEDYARFMIDNTAVPPSLPRQPRLPTNTAGFVLLPPDLLPAIQKLVRSPCSGVSIAAIAALTKIQYYCTPSNIEGIDLKKQLSQPLLPALIPHIVQSQKSLLDNRVFRTLAVLCRDDHDISKLAAEAGVISSLAAIVKNADTEEWSDSELVAECLLALAALSLHDNKLRDDVIATGILAPIVQMLLAKPQNPISVAAFGLRKIKVAACHVIRALARSISLLRTTLTTVDIVDGIYELLQADPYQVISAYEQLYGPDFADKEQTLEDELSIKSAVMAAVCNLIPEFSCLRSTMIQRGFLTLIVQGAYSSYPPLKLNSLWALKHAIFGLSEPHKLMVVRQLTPKYIMALCNDPEPQIQEQALCFLRNFVYAKNIGLADELFAEIGMDTFLDTLEEKLIQNCGVESGQGGQGGGQGDGGREKTEKTEKTDKTEKTENKPPSADSILDIKLDQKSLITISIIYILVHIATLSDDYRDLLMTRETFLKALLPLLKHPVCEVKVACFWVVINLAYHVDPAVGTAVGTAVGSGGVDSVGLTATISPGSDSSMAVRSAPIPRSSDTGESENDMEIEETSKVEQSEDNTSPQGPDQLASHSNSHPKPTLYITQRYQNMTIEERVKNRVAKLVEWGFVDGIKENVHDPVLDVAQRAKEALRQLIKYSQNGF